MVFAHYVSFPPSLIIGLSLVFSDGWLVSGFTHSAFAFGYEAGIDKSRIDVNVVPPGALVTFIQKGIQYLELEANLSGVSILIYRWIISCSYHCY